MFYITVSNGLLTADHHDRMGEAVWMFMWCIDKITKIDDGGWGYVLGGKPIKIDEIKVFSRRTAFRYLKTLEEQGYILRIRTPYGIIIKVRKAKKSFGRSARSGTSEVPEVAHHGDKSGTSNKTVSVDKSSKTILATPKQPMSWKEYNENNPPDDVPTIGDEEPKPEKIPKAKLPAIHEWITIWNQYPNWKTLKKAGTPPNPTVQKILLPIATRSRDVEGAILRRRSRYSTEDFARGVKNYAQEICNRKPTNNGYHEHRHTLYEFLIKKTVLESYVNR